MKIFMVGMLLTLFACSCVAVPVKIKPASLFQNNMVLQQKIKLPVWGTANAGETVSVDFSGQKKTAIADDNGDWKVILDPVVASAIPGKMAISGSVNPTPIVIENILVGEVWLCSGQSNMELSVKDCNNAKQEINQATDGNIRVFTVGHSGVQKPQKYCSGSWAINSPENAGKFTAAGYFFARELRAKLQVPVGIINSSWGGSQAQPWTPWEYAVKVTAMKGRIDSFANSNTLYLADKIKYQEQVKATRLKYDQDRQQWMQDFMNNEIGQKEKWNDPATDTKNWLPMKLPMPNVANSLNNMGSYWFRLDLQIPDAWVGKKLTLNLGAIDDGDVTWVNGTEIGRTLYDNPNGWRTPRHYTLSADLIKTSQISIVIRAVNQVFSLGIYGKASDMSLAIADDANVQPISLATTWKSKVGSEFDMTKQPFLYNSAFPEQVYGDLGNFYNGMIAPLAGYGIKGTLWYQGESNANEPDVYAELFPALIRGWRNVWGQGDFPFYFVQLAGFCSTQSFPVEKSSWAEVREAQMKGLTLPHTGMAVITDIGDAADIHPRNKQDVGKRLALIALANDYGQKTEYSGPIYKSMKISGKKFKVTFDHSKGLNSGKDNLTGFAIAGADKIFHWANCKISGRTVTVWSDKVTKPVAVRYGWAFLPIGNLYNNTGLPASQFRTDTWPRSEINSGDPIQR